MKQHIKKIILLFFSPLTYVSSLWLREVAKRGRYEDWVSETIFMKTGLLPVTDHYDNPLINPKKYLKRSLRDDRDLPGIDLNVEEQIQLLNNFCYSDEILKFPLNRRKKNEFYFNNPMYSLGDAEYLYNVIRYFKPKRIIEIGCGFSTLLIRNAIAGNKNENAEYTCNHTCVEPYENPCLKEVEGIEIIRKNVESLNKSLFVELERNDILFIDASHTIRPQGVVLFEYLEVLPILKSGVLIHIHDIFTPKDYLDEWIYSHRLYNEQYLLEAFLTNNINFRIIGALNYLSKHHLKSFSAKCPVFAKEKNKKNIEPGAFWIVKNDQN